MYFESERYWFSYNIDIETKLKFEVVFESFQYKL